MTIFVDVNLGTAIKEPLIGLGFQVILHNEVFRQSTKDFEWIQAASLNKWAVLTPDKDAKKRGIERRAVIEGRLQYFLIRSRKTDVETCVEVVAENVDSIKALCHFMPGPFIASLTVQELKFDWLGDTSQL